MNENEIKYLVTVDEFADMTQEALEFLLSLPRNTKIQFLSDFKRDSQGKPHFCILTIGEDGKYYPVNLA